MNLAPSPRGSHVRTISFGLVDARAVFMDERTDSYFMLDPAAEERFHALLERGEPLGQDRDLLDALAIGDEPADVLRAHYPCPTASLVEQNDRQRTSPADILKVISLVRRTGSRLKAQPIESVLQQLFALAGDSPPDEPNGEQLAIEACRFLRARKLVPIARNCLLDSLSLLSWLEARRSGLALVFGAKLDPFAAHCWLQSGELLFNDRIETVAAFSPVRVIECLEVTR